MYNTNHSVSNPVQTSEEYSFEGRRKMKKNRSSFSLSTIIGAVVFGVLVLGLLAVRMGSEDSQDIRNQASGPSLKEQMEAGDGSTTTTPREGSEAGTTEGQIVQGGEGMGGEGEGCDNGVPIGGTACQSQGDQSQYRCMEGSFPGASIWQRESCSSGQTCQGTSCQQSGGSTCAYPTCDSSCGSNSSTVSCGTNCASGSSCQTGKNTFYCHGKFESGCGEGQAYKEDGLGRVNFSDIRVNREDWCSTIQIDAWAATNINNGTEESDFAIMFVGDNGQYCIRYSNGTQTCDPNTLDWDCSQTTPTPTPSCPLTSMNATCVEVPNDPKGAVRLQVNWSEQSGTPITRYILRADNEVGNTQQCYNPAGNLVGWACANTMAACQPGQTTNCCAPNQSCDDRYKLTDTGAATRSYTFTNATRGETYGVSVALNSLPNCNVAAATVSCPSVACNKACVSDSQCIGALGAGHYCHPTAGVCRLQANPGSTTCELPPPSSPPITPPPTTPSPTPGLQCDSDCSYRIGNPDPCEEVNKDWYCKGTTVNGTTTGSCRDKSNPDDKSCKPIAIGPMCLGISRHTQPMPNDPNPNAPDVGQYVSFICDQVQGFNVEYDFRWIKPDGVEEKLNKFENTGNSTLPYLVTMPGQYHAQCRLCLKDALGGDNLQCQEWEPLPAVKGAQIEIPSYDESAINYIQ